MSAAKKKRAARSPRASIPDAARPWFAPKPRFYVAAIGYARVMRHTDKPFVVQKVATCDSPYQARQLARALNREERARDQVEVWRHECALRRDVLCDLVEDLSLPHFCRPPAVRECVWDQVERLLEEGGRR